MSRWVVIGAGYTGGRLVAAVTARGDEVIATRRRASLDVCGVDLTLPGTLADMFSAGDVVIVTAPPIDAHGTGERALVAAADAAGVARIVYVSTTGVYAPAAGAWVDEDFAIAPTTRDGEARVAAEAAIRAARASTVIVRAPGIYGPGRGALARLRVGTYRVVGDGTTAISRVHVDDLVAALMACGAAATPAAIYNVADDDPCAAGELADAAATVLGVPPPPRVALGAVDADTAGMLTADRRISAARLKRDLGWAPRFASWRAALEAGRA